MNWFVIGGTHDRFKPYPEVIYAWTDADLTEEASGKEAVIMRVNFSLVDPVHGGPVRIYALATVNYGTEGVVIWAGEGDEGRCDCPDMTAALDTWIN